MKNHPAITGIITALLPGLFAFHSIAADCTPDGPGVKLRAKRAPDSTWVEYATRGLEYYPEISRAAPDTGLNQYGGIRARRADSTGFFHTAQRDGRWWLVDPEGCLYFNVAVVAVSAGSGRRTLEAREKLYGGSTSVWADSATNLLWNLGFNGTGAWSTDSLVKTSARRMAYCPILNFMSGYGKKRGGTFAKPGHTGYPNDLIFLFDPGFAEYCDERARELAKLKDDPWILGYFSDNEMPTPLDALDRYLALDSSDPGRQAAERWYVARKGALDSPIDRSDREAFLGFFADTYYGIVSRAIKKYDPNHLYLGSRINFFALPADFYRAKGAHVDVVSMNVYFQWDPHGPTLRKIAECTGKPLLITEWYAKGDDVGFPNTSGAGWIVPTQSDRGLWYQHFTLGLIQSRACVGWQWFKYMDNDTEDLKAELSNRDANKGLVTLGYVPYEALASRAAAVNRRVYRLCDHFDRTSPSAIAASSRSKVPPQFSLRAPRLNAKQQKRLTATTDISLEEWSAVLGALDTGATLSPATHSVKGRDSWSGPADASLKVRAAISNVGLHVLFEITDNHWQPLSDPKNDWKYDVADIFLDALAPEQITQDRLISVQNWAFTSTSHHYKVWLGGASDSTTIAHGKFVPSQWDFYSSNLSAASLSATLDSVTVRKAERNATTRLALFTIPLSHLAIPAGFKGEKRVAFTVGYNDMDSDTGAVKSLRWRGSDPYSSETGVCSWGELRIGK